MSDNTETTFVQPSLDNETVIDTNATMAATTETAFPVSTPITDSAVNSGKTDELSLAASQPGIVAAPVIVLPPGRYCLDYEYNGMAIHETHRTVPLALASIRRLKQLGIVPATSTAA